MAESAASRKYTVAELFCGCGGFSHGFARTSRFKVVLGNDLKKAALRTFLLNHSTDQSIPKIIEQDIRTVHLEKISKALKKKGVKEGDLDCLIGGPPCQGFSQMRRSEERLDSSIVRFKGYNRLDQDSRNDLVLRFLEVADWLRPKFIVIENVPQMQSHTHNGTRGGVLENVKELLSEMGYDPTVRIINAADFGVPQLRERLFILASRVCRATLPEPTHSDPESRDLLSLGRIPWTIVGDAIRDLPRPAPGPTDELGGGPVHLYRKIELSEYAEQMQSQQAFPYNHLSRLYSAEILNTIKEMRQGETWDYACERKRLEYEPLIARVMRTAKDREAAIEELVTKGIINRKFLNRYYWSAYTRLAWNRPALTITANANFLGSGRFTHPVQQRGITMREAARLQSFEDDFKFITSATDDLETTAIGTGLDMIGEAVPPLLAKKLAEHIAGLLDSEVTLTKQQLPVVRSATATTIPTET